MQFDDWLLALHLLSAFALVGSMTMFSIALVAGRSIDTPTRALALGSTLRVAQVAVVVGSLGTIIFGIWLAISLDAYQVWDAWVLLAILGWAIGTEAGRRGGTMLIPAYERAKELTTAGQDGPDAEIQATLRSSTASTLHWVSVAVVVLVLIDMIWKPGA